MLVEIICPASLKSRLSWNFQAAVIQFYQHPHWMRLHCMMHIGSENDDHDVDTNHMFTWEVTWYWPINVLGMDTLPCTSEKGALAGLANPGRNYSMPLMLVGRFDSELIFFFQDLWQYACTETSHKCYFCNRSSLMHLSINSCILI